MHVRSLLRLFTGAMMCVALVVGASSYAVATAAGDSAPPVGPQGDRQTRWAPADRATITPGVQMYTAGAQCTGNFVFTGAAGQVYVGYAAHCAGTGEATDTNGCTSTSLPMGTRVRFARGGNLAGGGTTVGTGTLVYSSWRTMGRLGLKPGSNACAANDFALVRVDKAHVKRVNPSVPVWGGPTALGKVPTVGARVVSYGQSSLRPGQVLSPKTGVSLGSEAGGWGWTAYTLTPGVPGDSGSGFLDSQGRAVGTLSTVALAPLAASNGLGTLSRELAFAQRHSRIAGLRLVPGTEAFNPNAVPIG